MLSLSRLVFWDIPIAHVGYGVVLVVHLCFFHLEERK